MNCYETCIYYYYLDNDNNFHCTDNDSCPDEYNKLIPNKKKCINDCSKDDIYKFEINNICYKEIPAKILTTFIFSDTYNNDVTSSNKYL